MRFIFETALRHDCFGFYLVARPRSGSDRRPIGIHELRERYARGKKWLDILFIRWNIIRDNAAVVLSDVIRPRRENPSRSEIKRFYAARERDACRPRLTR